MTALLPRKREDLLREAGRRRSELVHLQEAGGGELIAGDDPIVRPKVMRSLLEKRRAELVR